MQATINFRTERGSKSIVITIASTASDFKKLWEILNAIEEADGSPQSIIIEWN